ncbi:MAG: 6-phospho-beta-glucosidase [Clostridiaceae bacterium]|nr:6-phospho-beta-glucosidase [Eubacteriales bacterium]
MKSLNVAVIGSGSTYTPELVEGFILHGKSLPLKSFRFMDIDAKKNASLAAFARRMLKHAGLDVSVLETDNLEEAVNGADYVLAQIRVGGLSARIRDEKIPLKYGLIGQETVGAGGFMNALRTIPEMMKVASAMERFAPEAWLVNFSNPSGIVAEALQNHTNVKSLGLCNIPITMAKEAQRLFENEAADCDFIGLNHLVWMTGVFLGGKNVLPDMLEGGLTFGGMKNVPDMGFEPELLRLAGGVPCSYFNYYYYPERMLHKCLSAERTRGEEVSLLEQELLNRYQSPALEEKPEELEKRGGAYYSYAAVSLVDALENDRRAVHVVNVKSGGTTGFLRPSDVVETRCLVGKNGAEPLSARTPPTPHVVSMMQTLKSYERLTVEAALTGSYETALSALMLNPLVGDYHKAKGALDEMLLSNRAFLPQFEGYFLREEKR